ncbi:hypothetical protein [Pseudonocardia oroxyli]|uniref:Uncharacterized protein n=1 Tax=Pseudonocardia oroxyli TaxID=366584 RepID=A0A1G7ULT9_PSEOR|nr:hypothetical protein [Pseudonocardia oroxyli]SDG48484.1 hypothetical protein SAMN05216377_11286 [Pseudonocardia oroxyli]
MEHHETATARALKLSVIMLRVLFSRLQDGKPSTLKALVTRGLIVADVCGVYSLTDEGERVRAVIDGEVVQVGAAEGVQVCESCDAPARLVVVDEREPWDQVFCATHGADIPGAVPLEVVEAEAVVSVGPIGPVRQTVEGSAIRPGITIGLPGDREVLVTSVEVQGREVRIIGDEHGSRVELFVPLDHKLTLLDDGALISVEDLSASPPPTAEPPKQPLARAGLRLVTAA